MILATLICAIACSRPSQGEDDWARNLGRARSEYGDIPNSGLWKHGYTGQFGGTTILFRAGRSTERYYCTTSPGAKRWRLSRTTLVHGAIRKDWMIFIENGRDSRIKSPGALWKWAEGGKIVGHIGKMALHDLQSRVPLALYHSNVNFSYCGFVFPDGKTSEPKPWTAYVIRKTPDGATLEDYSSLPKTSAPYPVTEEERQYAYKKRGRP